MFDIKEPKILSLIALIVSLVLSIMILYCSKPSWILVVSSYENKTKISWPLLLSYSFTFAFVCAIGSLLISTKERGPVSEVVKKDSNIYPSQQLAFAYRD